MDCLACVLLLIALYGLAAKAPRWIVTGERPLERPRDWPVGVQESDPSYAISRMEPRVPPPPERIEPVATSHVSGHVSLRG